MRGRKRERLEEAKRIELANAGVFAKCWTDMGKIYNVVVDSTYIWSSEGTAGMCGAQRSLFLLTGNHEADEAFLLPVHFDNVAPHIVGYCNIVGCETCHRTDAGRRVVGTRRETGRQGNRPVVENGFL